MNQRIKELAKESGIMDYTKIFVPEMEKFAELIIQECAQVAKLTEEDDGDDYKSGRQWAGIDVLKHFGVEE